MAIVEVLGELEDLRTIEPLTQTIRDDGHPEVRKAAKKALLKFGEPRIISLIQAFEELYIRERAGAVYVLGAIRDLQAVETLIQALQNNNYAVRVKAARTLGKIGDPRAVNPLVKALDDPHPDVQTTAQKALAKLQGQKPRNNE